MMHPLTSSTRRENAVARSGFHPSVCRDWHWPRAAFELHEAVPLCGSPHAAQPIRRKVRPEGWKGGREEGAELIQVSRAARALPCTDHDACALAVDVAALLQLTAWVEKLDAINHMNGGEDQLIINIRSQAVGVLGPNAGMQSMR